MFLSSHVTYAGTSTTPSNSTPSNFNEKNLLCKEPCSSLFANRVDVQAINTVGLPVHNCGSIDDLGKYAGRCLSKNLIQLA
jgi:hypothetical protein